MFSWVFELATGIFLYGGPCVVSHDPATQGVVRVPRHPEPHIERYDGAGGIRAATAEEIADYDSMQSSREENARFNGDKLLKALVIWMAGKQGMTVQEARAEIISIYRGL